MDNKRNMNRRNNRIFATQIPHQFTGVEPHVMDTKPDYIRLPKNNEKCPYCGLSRTTLNELVLPRADNNFTPPVKSRVVSPKRGSLRGVRLINYDSLMVYLETSDNGGN